MAYYKARKGKRTDVPTITVPRTLTQITYFNTPLALMLQKKNIDKVFVEIDKPINTIILRKPKKGEKGYSIIRTGLRGHGITPKLRKVLPAGKYAMADGRTLAFVRD